MCVKGQWLLSSHHVSWFPLVWQNQTVLQTDLSDPVGVNSYYDTILVLNLSCFALFNSNKAADNYLFFPRLGYVVTTVCLPADRKDEERHTQSAVTLSPSSCYQSAGGLPTSHLCGGITSTQDFHLTQHLHCGQPRSATQPSVLSGFTAERVWGYEYRPCLWSLIYCLSWCLVIQTFALIL